MNSCSENLCTTLTGLTLADFNDSCLLRNIIQDKKNEEKYLKNENGW